MTQMPEIDNLRAQKQGTSYFSAALGMLLVPVVFIGACFAVPYSFLLRLRQQRREDALKSLMRSQGRFISWAEFLRTMRESGGTCIEERFSAKGPVRFWWTPENVYGEEFGTERLSALLERGFALSAESLMSTIFSSASDFCNQVRFADDVTILVVKCNFDGSM